MATFIAAGSLAVAAVFDLGTGKIPNWLVLYIYMTGAIIQVVEKGLGGIITFLFQAMWPIAILYITYLIGALGAGDIKLISAAATLIGVSQAKELIIFSLFVGAGIGIIKICKNNFRIPAEKLHFAFSIFTGYFLVVVKGALLE